MRRQIGFGDLLFDPKPGFISHPKTDRVRIIHPPFLPSHSPPERSLDVLAVLALCPLCKQRAYSASATGECLALAIVDAASAKLAALTRRETL